MVTKGYTSKYGLFCFNVNKYTNVNIFKVHLKTMLSPANHYFLSVKMLHSVPLMSELDFGNQSTVIHTATGFKATQRLNSKYCHCTASWWKLSCFFVGRHLSSSWIHKLSSRKLWSTATVVKMIPLLLLLYTQFSGDFCLLAPNRDAKAPIHQWRVWS